MSVWDDLKRRIAGSSRGAEEEREREELDRAPPVEAGGVRRGEAKKEEIKRINKKELERLYYEDPLVHAGVNFYVRQITGEDFRLVKTPSTEDNDLHRVRSFVEESRLGSKLSDIMRDLAIYGNAFGEIIWNKKGDRVKDLVTLDPKQMEFIKRKETGQEEAATDQMGRPLGFIQKPANSFGQSTKEGRYQKILKNFDEVKLADIEMERGIPFHRDKIVHFKLQKTSDTMMGIGLIEPIYDIVDMRMAIEDSLKDGIDRGARPDLVGKVGTFQEEEPVRAKDTDALRKSLEKMRSQEFGVISIPKYWDVEQLESDVGGNEDLYNIFYDLTLTGMGIPPSLLSRGEGVPSGVADVQFAQTEKVISSFQNSISTDCREQIFTVLLETDNTYHTPRMVWKELNPLTKRRKANRIGELARAGLLTRDRELEEHLRELESLPPLPEETEEEKEKREEKGKKQTRRASRGHLSENEEREREELED